jgi:hypothetical protein
MRRHQERSAVQLLAVVMTIVAVVGALSLTGSSRAQQGGEGELFESSSDAAIPRTDGAKPADLSPTEIQALQEQYLAGREDLVARLDSSAAETKDSAGLADIPVDMTQDEAAGKSEFHGTPTNLTVARNVVNTVVTASPGFRSNLGEPAVVNRGKDVFYTGNTFASFSSNDGSTWSNHALITPLFTGDFNCCDQDLEIDQGRNRIFWSTLFLQPNDTRGVVTIAVLTSPSAAPSCFYDYHFGQTSNITPDYPHIALSNDFLYLTTNNIDGKGTTTTTDDSWVSATVVRYNLDQMVDCVTASRNTFTDNTAPQRVYVPVEGATDRMYWGSLDNATTFRIYEWPEASTTVSSVTRAITSSPHNNPDCRGGTNNTDFIEKSTAFSITGFRMRGWYGQRERGGGADVVGFLWNVGTDASHAQAHIHAAVFDADTKNLISQPHIWNASFCLGFPDVAPTDRGHPAIILAYGGKSGGGGLAVRNAVLLGDDTVTAGGPFGDFVTVATGTHNPSDSRYGDYLTIQRHEPCGNFLAASGYVLVNGTAGSNTQQRYIQFGRQRDKPCWDYWHLQP